MQQVPACLLGVSVSETRQCQVAMQLRSAAQDNDKLQCSPAGL